jgi:isocitrate dehydrogenase
MKPIFSQYEPPAQGDAVRLDAAGKLVVPDHPILLTIEGDGIGTDITPAALGVWNAAVQKAYGGKRKVHWFEVFAGQKAFRRFGEWMPADTLTAFRHYRVGVKGPLDTPTGGGIRSLNVTLRQELDLYACVRPVRYFRSAPSPLRHPERLNVTIFRETTEDIYSGIEWQQGTPEALRVLAFLKDQFGKSVRADSGLGIKPISLTATKKLARAALQHAVDAGKKRVTIVHKGNVMKFTEGAFRDWVYAVARDEFRQHVVTAREKVVLDERRRNPGVTAERLGATLRDEAGLGYTVEEVAAALQLEQIPGRPLERRVVVNDLIMDVALQQLLLQPQQFEVIVTANQHGDYLSDACAAQVGGMGFAPGANVGDGVFCGEASHGTAPKYAGLDAINPTALILSGCLMFDYLGWSEVPPLINQAIERMLERRQVTVDLHRFLPEATRVSCSDFARAVASDIAGAGA